MLGSDSEIPWIPHCPFCFGVGSPLRGQKAIGHLSFESKGCKDVALSFRGTSYVGFPPSLHMHPRGYLERDAPDPRMWERPKELLRRRGQLHSLHSARQPSAPSHSLGESWRGIWGVRGSIDPYRPVAWRGGKNGTSGALAVA